MLRNIFIIVVSLITSEMRAMYSSADARVISTAQVVNGTITINEPGAYQFIGSLKLTERTTGSSLLHITSSDVTIDFAGFTLEGKKAQSNITGILINTGLSNIKLLNGTIKNCSGRGMVIEHECYNVQCKNMSFISIQSPAISALNCGALSFDQVSINVVQTTADTSRYAIGLFDTTGMLIAEDGSSSFVGGYNIGNCNLSQLQPSTDAKSCALVFDSVTNAFVNGLTVTNWNGKTSVGVCAYRSRCCLLENIAIKNLAATSASSGVTCNSIGVLFDTSSDCSIKQATIAANSAQSGFYGIKLNICTQTRIENSDINSNQADTTFYGLLLQGGLRNTISNVRILENRTSLSELKSKLACGISLSSAETKSLIDHCTILGQFSGGICFGIVLGYNSDAASNNVISNNIIGKNQGLTNSYGFYDYGIGNGTLLFKNIAYGQGAVFFQGTSNVKLKNHMNYYSHDIVDNTIGVINEFVMTNQNAQTVLENTTPINISYALYES